MLRKIWPVFGGDTSDYQCSVCNCSNSMCQEDAKHNTTCSTAFPMISSSLRALRPSCSASGATIWAPAAATSCSTATTRVSWRLHSVSVSDTCQNRQDVSVKHILHHKSFEGPNFLVCAVCFCIPHLWSKTNSSRYSNHICSRHATAYLLTELSYIRAGSVQVLQDHREHRALLSGCQERPQTCNLHSHTVQGTLAKLEVRRWGWWN